VKQMTYKQHEVMKTLYSLMDRMKLESKGWDQTSRIAREIRLAHRILDRNAINRCNGIERWDEQARKRLASWTDDDEARADRLDARAEARVRDALRALFGDRKGEVAIHFQGDPRGALIVIQPAGAQAQDSGARLASW
jgi:hypothetical protein